MRHRVTALEIFGLEPLGPALRQCRLALAGDEHLPPTRWDRTSLAILRPRDAVPLWLGRERRDGRVTITGLPNRNRPPARDGYSVRVTDCRDFRGGRLTYDSHAGTDFAVPVGTEVRAAAPGIVRQVRNDMNRGGLKVIVDHGGGLVTTSNHLARALVCPGQPLARGEVLGLSGMSSIDGLLFFPWLPPHLHLNVCLDGAAVDPFAGPGETPLWRDGNEPRPHEGAAEGAIEPTAWDPDGVAATIALCRDPRLRDELRGIVDPAERAVAVVAARVFAGALFDELPPMVERPSPRRPVLTLPFGPEYRAGVRFADER